MSETPFEDILICGNVPYEIVDMCSAVPFIDLDVYHHGIEGHSDSTMRHETSMGSGLRMRRHKKYIGSRKKRTKRGGSLNPIQSMITGGSLNPIDSMVTRGKGMRRPYIKL